MSTASLVANTVVGEPTDISKFLSSSHHPNLTRHSSSLSCDTPSRAPLAQRTSSESFHSLHSSSSSTLNTQTASDGREVKGITEFLDLLLYNTRPAIHALSLLQKVWESAYIARVREVEGRINAALGSRTDSTNSSRIWIFDHTYSLTTGFDVDNFRGHVPALIPNCSELLKLSRSTQRNVQLSAFKSILSLTTRYPSIRHAFHAVWCCPAVCTHGSTRHISSYWNLRYFHADAEWLLHRRLASLCLETNELTKLGDFLCRKVYHFIRLDWEESGLCQYIDTLLQHCYGDTVELQILAIRYLGSMVEFLGHRLFYLQFSSEASVLEKVWDEAESRVDQASLIDIWDPDGIDILAYALLHAFEEWASKHHFIITWRFDPVCVKSFFKLVKTLRRARSVQRFPKASHKANTDWETTFDWALAPDLKKVVM